MDKMKVIFFSIFALVEFLSWVFIKLLTSFKYLWCKRNCDKCGCWTCKFYHEKKVINNEKK